MEMIQEISKRINQLLCGFGYNVSPDAMNSIIMVLSEYSIAKNDIVSNLCLSRGIQQFLAVKKIDGLSGKTIRNYQLILNSFAKQIAKAPEHITTDDIREYLVVLSDVRKLKDNSIVTYINTLKSFFGWMHDEERITKNPMKKIHPKKLDKVGSRQALSAEELEQLRDACISYREKALVELYYSTGCRLSEIAAASRNDINLQDRSLRVVGKGNKERIVYFNNRAKYMLIEYFSQTPQGLGLFCSTKKPNKPLTTRAIQTIIRSIGERSKVGRRVHPHLLRHTFATLAINAGMNITVIQTILGHADVGTTQIYATINQTTVRREYDRVVA